MTMCWYGDAPATCEYWFHEGGEWRPICDSHELVVRDNLPPHFIRDLPALTDGAESEKTGT